MNPRLIASRVIDKVTDGRSLTDVLAIQLQSVSDPRDRAFIQAICYGVCRYYARLDYVISLLIEKPMKAKDSDVHSLLLVGLYQLMEMRVPPHAAVAETVNAAVKLNKSWARGFVNAILREYLRKQADIQQAITEDDEAHYAHPDWWIHTIKAAWPMHWQAILSANNEQAPLAIRVNQAHLSRDDYLQRLIASGHAATLMPETEHGILLAEPIAAENLPGFYAGDVSVQDGAAQLAGTLLDLAPNLRVLDACSAPGGKLTHLLEMEPALASVVAVEKDKTRMAIIHENLTRLQLTATCIHADAINTADWWDGNPFDRILLDAPCSASGVIRRHPDIKLLRQPTDIDPLAEEQIALLKALWPTLKPGGKLLYATCSIFPAENVDVLSEFIKQQPDAAEEKITASFGQALEIGRQILPGEHGMDGFYYGLLVKARSVDSDG